MKLCAWMVQNEIELVWIGDLVHTARTLASSTYRLDNVTGVLEFEAARQQESGLGTRLVPTDAQLGVSSQNKDDQYPILYPITDYQIFYLITIGLPQDDR